MVTRAHHEHIAVIGAGLAGAACARALSRAGFGVTVLEQAGAAATGASGNPVGILHQLVSKDRNLASQWVEVGMATTLRWLGELSSIAQENELGILGAACGVAQLTENADDLIYWDPTAAWIQPQWFVMACLADAKAHGAIIRYNSGVMQVAHDGSVVLEDDSINVFDAILVCSAHNMEALLTDCGLELNAIRGTVSAYALPVEHSLPCVICASGYATPVIEGQMVVGASYERLPVNAAAIDPDREVEGVSNSDTDISNLDRLRIIDARLAEICAHAPVVDRTSIRSATLDRMPHVGRVLDPSVPLSARVSQLHQMPRSPRIWALGGLGSRGLSSAALGAELITAQMMGALLPVSARLVRAVDPVRFALRRHQRRK
jgi:tRNA 5-methylaminomethyl-2-thiouridine biosynthesis bifunctional protein